MEKSYNSSGDSNNNSSNFQSQHYHRHPYQNSGSNSRYQNFKQLNKVSTKISKDLRPAPIRKYPLDHLRHNQQEQVQQQQEQHHHQQSQQQQQQQQHHLSQQQHQHQHQPPVYNINKNDFRDVVQKLTGSPAHERSFSTPPPIHPPKPQSSRLQRIGPPPLAHLSPRFPSPLSTTILPPTTMAVAGNVAGLTNNAANTNSAGNDNGRLVSPLSPLPPFPAVNAAAESSISAYMRYLQSSILTVDNKSKRFSSGFLPLVSPQWNNNNNHHHSHSHRHSCSSSFVQRDYVSVTVSDALVASSARETPVCFVRFLSRCLFVSSVLSL